MTKTDIEADKKKRIKQVAHSSKVGLVKATRNPISCIPEASMNHTVKFEPPNFIKLDKKVKINLEHSRSLLVQKLDIGYNMKVKGRTFTAN